MSIINRSLKVKIDNQEEAVLVLDKITVDQNRPVTAYLCLRSNNQTVVVLPEEIETINMSQSEGHFFKTIEDRAN